MRSLLHCSRSLLGSCIGVLIRGEGLRYGELGIGSGVMGIEFDSLTESCGRVSKAVDSSPFEELPAEEILIVSFEARRAALVSCLRHGGKFDLER